MAYRSSVTSTSNVSGTLGGTPTGLAAHDYLCGVYVGDGSGTPTVPTGWTSRLNQDQATPDGQIFRFADKLDATGSDAVGWTTVSSTGNSVINACWSGRNNTTPRTALVGTTDTTARSSGFAETITGVTAAGGDDIAVFMQTDETASSNAWSFSTITSYTEREDVATADWMAVGLDTRDNVSAGATGSLSCTISSAAGTTGFGAIVVAIAAATAAASIPLLTTMGVGR